MANGAELEHFPSEAASRLTQAVSSLKSMWAEHGQPTDVPQIPLIKENLELAVSGSYQIFVPTYAAHPEGLARFNQSHPHIRNEYLFQIAGGIPLVNTENHAGWRSVSPSAPDGQGLTFNEFVIAAKTHREFRSLVEGRWVKISGTSSPKGDVLNVAIDKDGSIISYFGDGIRDVMKFSSHPLKP